MTVHRVLVIDDDHGLRDVLARGLRAEGFDVGTARDGEGGIRAATARPPHVIVLDVGLPDSDGRDVCQALRARGIEVPVLFLSARDGVTDRLFGFSAGGDDYLPKPFAFPELVARLRALLRRFAGPPVTTYSDLRLSPTDHALWCDDEKVALSPTEFRLLACLLAAANSVVRRSQLAAAGWPHGAVVSDNTLDQYIAKLRRKLTDVGSPQEIRVARGVGYQIA